SHGHARGLDPTRRRPGGHQLDPRLVQAARELLQPPLVVDGDQGALDRATLAHGMVTFRWETVKPSRTMRPTQSTSIWRSAVLMRSCRLSTVSTPASTTNRVAPVTLTPYASASRGPCIPGKDGDRAGWVLTVRPPNRARNAAPVSRMKPARTTRHGSYAATCSVSAASQSSRVAWSATAQTNVGMPARRARARPSMSSRSAPTAATRTPYAGSAAASSNACRLVPPPETRTTTSPRPSPHRAGTGPLSGGVV